MSVSDVDLLSYAEALTTAAICEVSYRNAVSRAYYAIYHKAENFHGTLLTPGSVTKDGGMHAQLSSRLSNPTVSCLDLRKKSKMAGYICQDMHFRRVDADYKLEKKFTSDDAQYGIEVAKRLFDALK